jgi:hypothetical protein
LWPRWKRIPSSWWWAQSYSDYPTWRARRAAQRPGPLAQDVLCQPAQLSGRQRLHLLALHAGELPGALCTICLASAVAVHSLHAAVAVESHCRIDKSTSTQQLQVCALAIAAAPATQQQNQDKQQVCANCINTCAMEYTEPGGDREPFQVASDGELIIVSARAPRHTGHTLPELKL